MALPTNLYQFLVQALFSKPKLLNASTVTIHTATQTTGTGLSDLTMGGTYTATVDHTYDIKISTAAGTDKFEWRKDGGSWSGEVTITGAAQTLSEGVTVTFGATTGHTLNNQWQCKVNAGVALATAQTINDLLPNQVGNGATLSIYDGSGTDGDLIYQGVTAAWTAGVTVQINKYLQNSKGLYLVLSTTTTFPTLTVGYN